MCATKPKIRSVIYQLIIMHIAPKTIWQISVSNHVALANMVSFRKDYKLGVKFSPQIPIAPRQTLQLSSYESVTDMRRV